MNCAAIHACKLVLHMYDHHQFCVFASISTSVVYKDSCLMAGAKKHHHQQSGSEEVPTSHPSKWPGKMTTSNTNRKAIHLTWLRVVL